MRLCVINNIIMLLIIIVLGKISYNILRNKKNYETFTNSGWYLNHDGELCYESTCEDIAVLGSGDSGKICTISGNTLECEKIEEGAVAEDAVAESVTVEAESVENVDSGVDCLGTNVDNITISSDGIVSTTIEIYAISINNIFGQANSELANVLGISSSLNGDLEVGFNLLGQTYTGGELLTITNINDGAYINISDPYGESETYDITKDEDLDGCYIITKRTSS